MFCNFICIAICIYKKRLAEPDRAPGAEMGQDEQRAWQRELGGGIARWGMEKGAELAGVNFFLNI